MLTDQRLEEFIFVKEGGNRVAYDDFQPWKKLEPGDEILGTLTYGPGFIKRPDGSPVQIGDSMTDQEAYDRVRQYIAEEVEPVLEDLIHVPIATSLANALGSLVYNFGGSEVYGWRLWGRINSGEPVSAIIREWVDGTFSSKGVPMLGLWRRRFSELALAMNVDWRAGDNVDWETDPEEFLQVLGWDGTMPKPDPIVDEDLFKELEIPPMKKQVITDPTPETPITTADANWMQLESLKHPDRPIVYADFDTSRAVTTQRNKIQTPKVDLKKPPKPMEDSKTHRGLAKRTSGRDDAWIGGVIAGASTMAGTASGISKDVSTITKNTQTVVGGATLHQIMIFGLVIGGGLLLYGLWKMFRGETIAREGREEADVLKV